MKKYMTPMIAVAGLMVTSAAFAQEPVKIGFVNTFSGPNAAIGNDKKDAATLAVEHLGGKMGNRKIELIIEDDQMKPEVGKQVTEKLVLVDKVDFLTGYNWSNVLLASVKPAFDNKTFLISANAGPSPLAGKQCSPYFFSTSWQNDQTPMTQGEALNKKGIKKLFVLAPNYAAGRDMANGVKRTFKGEVVGEEYTRWPGHVDFSAELSKVRAANPDAVWVFYPGQSGVQFFQQYVQAGLNKTIPLYSSFTVDALSLPQLKDLAGGHQSTQSWVADIDNAENKKFVADYKKKFGRYPTYYAAQAYDAIMLINGVVTDLKGDLSNKDAVRKSLEKAPFKSVRGNFKYNNNHFPIADFYSQEAKKDAEGNFVNMKIEVVAKDYKDPYGGECEMK